MTKKCHQKFFLLKCNFFYTKGTFYNFRSKCAVMNFSQNMLCLGLSIDYNLNYRPMDYLSLIFILFDNFYYSLL